ncbi:MAG: A/G-specific adenine glycosylase, partial [Candidatus Korobacteraceae bacterium]
MGDLLKLASTERSRFRSRLLRWYRVHRRALPWRETSDSYAIWVSEVMLQQTRVAAVLSHYRRFLDRFPSVFTLAEAELPEVLSAWSGLGYYRRARGLHAAARKIVQEHDGQLPRTAEQLLPLPGFGRYTAAAVASIAFGQPVAVLDGNVERVLRRLSGISDANTNTLWRAAEELLSRRFPSDFNQAMMELGATICLPVAPRCPSCPVRGWCAARHSANGSAALRGKPRSPRHSLEISVMLAQRSGRVLLIRRPESATVMPGLWELPPLTAPLANGTEPVLVVRHAIMQ